MTQNPPARSAPQSLGQRFRQLLRRSPSLELKSHETAAAPTAQPSDSSAAITLEALTLEAIALAQTLESGAHGRRRSGSGDDFWQFRPYQPGEPAASIDWRQSARSPAENSFWVREREQDTPHTLALWSDPSASMAWRSEQGLPTKAERAQLCALTLATAALKGGERVTSLTGPAKGRSLAGHTALPQLAHSISTPENTNALPNVTTAPRGASLVIISDFLWDEAELKQWFQDQAHHSGRIVLLCILDPAERALNTHGRVRFEGLEGGTLTLPALESLNTAYHNTMTAHLTTLNTLAATAGIPLIHHITTDNPLPALLSLHAALGGAR